MDEDALRTLRDQLGEAPPKGLARLDGDELRALADALREAAARQSATLDAATEEALRHVPRLLRGPVRRVLGV